MKKFFVFSALALLMALVSGCGSRPNVSGIVSFEDGEKLSSGTVYFDNGKLSAFGIIQPDGTYVMGITEVGERIPTGDYTVFLGSPMSDASSSKAGSKNGPPVFAGVPLVASQFTSAKTSPLKFTVVSGRNVFDFKVARNPAAK